MKILKIIFIFVFSSQLMANKISIIPKYAPIVKFDVYEDLSDLDKKLKRSFKKAFYVRNEFTAGGRKPSFWMHLETPLITNAFLSDLEYDILSVRDDTGNSILRKEKRESRFFRRIHLGSWSNTVKFPLMKGVRKRQLDKARVRIHGTIPSDIIIFRFKKDELGTSKEKGGVKVTLKEFSHNRVMVWSNGKEVSMRLRSFDTSKKEMAVTFHSMERYSAFAEYNGVVDLVEVVVIRKEKKFSTVVSLDLNHGKAELMPKEPTINIPRHYLNRVRDYRKGSDKNVLKSLKARWNSPVKKGGQKSICIGPIPDSLLLKSKAKVHLLGSKGELNHNRINTSFYNGEVKAKIPTELAEKVKKAFGNIDLIAFVGLKRYTFLKRKERLTMRQEFQGKKVSVNFEKNVVTLSVPKEFKELVFDAYDAAGYMLRRERRLAVDEGYQYFYWGVPMRVELQYSTKVVSRSLDFDFDLGSYDKEKLERLKNRLTEEGQLIEALSILFHENKKLAKPTFDLASLYYGVDGKGNKRERLPIGIANATSKKVSKMSFKRKAYKGYYFKVLKKRPLTKTQGLFAKKLGAQRRNSMAIMAYPADKTRPSYILSGNKLVNLKGLHDYFEPESFFETEWTYIYKKNLNGRFMKLAPKSYSGTGWTRIE